jgi:hypothetical protein
MSRFLPAILLSLAVTTNAPAAAQHIPPHSNDPHPPANQPAYQLPSPLSRPGVPQYPGAAHSNDPHFRRNEATIVWPSAPVTPDARFPSTPPQYTTQPYQRSTRRAPAQRAPVRKEAAKPAKKKTATLEECFGRYYDGVGMSRASWDNNCRRLAAEGRLRAR